MIICEANYRVGVKWRSQIHFEGGMKIRVDSVFLSCVLFTFALVCLIPTFSSNVLTQRDLRTIASLGDGYLSEAREMSDLSVASLAMILVALIVVWTGYRKRTRWTWFVMCIVVWAWAFPILLLPLFRGQLALTVAEWFYNAIDRPGLPRIAAELILTFLLMTIALVLPIKSFFFTSEPTEPFRVTPKLLSLSVVGALVGATAVFAWIRVGVVYQIPCSVLNVTQRLPAPIAPPEQNN
jgi:hypothetical protein